MMKECQFPAPRPVTLPSLLARFDLIRPQHPVPQPPPGPEELLASSGGLTSSEKGVNSRWNARHLTLEALSAL